MRAISGIAARAALATCLSLTVTNAVSASTIAVYDLNAALNQTLPVSTVAGGFTASPLTAVGVTGVAFSNHFYFSNWDPTLNTAKYLELTLGSAGPYELGQVLFSVENTGGTLSNLFVRSSVDAFGANVSSFSWLSPTTDVTNGSLDLTSLGLLTGNTTLRFYFTATSTGIFTGFANHEPPGAGAGLPDIGRDLSITATAVPEPTSMLLLGAGLAGLAARRRGRRSA